MPESTWKFTEWRFATPEVTAMNEILPAQVRAAMKGSVRDVVRAVADVEKANPDLGLLTLWVLSNSGSDAEYGRILAIKSTKSESRIAMACRLWLMGNRSSDLGVANTLLGALEREAVDSGSWPTALGGELIDFLRKCLSHKASSVRAGVLSVFVLALERNFLASVFPKNIAASLARTLEDALMPFAEEDERFDLDRVKSALLTKTARAVLPLSPVALERIKHDLIESQEANESNLSGIDPLIDFVRRRTLFDDAGRQAIKLGRPIQTIRVLAEGVATQVFKAMVSFSEAVASLERHPEFEDAASPDYGIKLAWAPAASVPLHLLFPENDARQAFAVLQKLVGAEKHQTRVQEVISDVDPGVAQAVLSLVSRLHHTDGRLEIILTDPESPEWQQTLMLEPGVLGTETISGLMKRTRAAARSRGVVVRGEQVPQANSVRQVFQAVDAMLKRGAVEVEDIDDISTPRQVAYYKHGARVLGFFDEDNQPTERARALLGLSYEGRLAVTAVFFEDSPIGRAWRHFAGKDRLFEVEPATATDFLTTCVVGLTKTTPGRRASTLRSWFDELMPRYPK